MLAEELPLLPIPAAVLRISIRGEIVSLLWFQNCCLDACPYRIEEYS